ncbi:uracil-DNA glycosylase [Helicobacter sp. 12S02634-8]|uniref:uracil-DNA glycosylase n=1 Tax=Helicobacter sp. 12S02634-8 TaxID=1476199 RepID=UPI000BA7186E|nr:uracil-DNA glycosylase [Helicobacter sp. 12S02634-8]PAF46913.1 uracil-DNA glycosylase [Helicobacter sp. 12S02634-8]
MPRNTLAITPEWQALLAEEFDKPYFSTIKSHYIKAKSQGAIIYPPSKLTFNALNLTPPSKVQIVILGQDPYHGSFISDGVQIPQATGLCFCVPPKAPIPPSLKNIYKELHNSIGFEIPNHGDISAWCARGALLLNAIFSVEKGKPGSHAHFGWENFSDSIIRCVSRHCHQVVFMLWGNYARKKASLIDTNKHTIITAPHPSPLAQGFLGSGVFLQAQMTFKLQGKAPFDWSLKNI